MTVLTAPTAPTLDARLSTVLRADAVVTGLVGAVLAVDAGPVARALSGAVDVPRWAVLATGVALVAVALDLLLAARWSGRKLRLAAVVTAELAAAWVAGSAVLLAVARPSAAGIALVVGVAAVTAGFATAYVRALRG